MNLSSSDQKAFYITTTLPYVNAQPHFGHAMEMVRADIIARYKKICGYDVFFNTGTDEHGQKLLDAAHKAGIEVKEYVDENAETFKSLLKTLGVTEAHHFIRTTDEKHIKGAQAFWKRVADNGYIYKGRYQTKYCVGCELEKSDSELVDGKCPEHPNLEIQLMDEENYFFKFSAFAERLTKLFEENREFVLPTSRANEALKFIERGLQDFSISRMKSKMSWGIPVPGDEDHVMYVWFDALTSYINTLGWPEDTDQFDKYWRNGSPVQYCGQDNLRQQSLTWQAMLLAADLPTTHTVIVNGFVMGEGGVKMSKTIGNVIDPLKLVETYGKEAMRLYAVKNVHQWEGSPVTYETFHLAYEAELVNGLGNLTSRLLNMSEKYLSEGFDPEEHAIGLNDMKVPQEWFDFLNEFRIDLATQFIWKKIDDLDKAISETEPFKMIKIDPERAKQLLTSYVKDLYVIALMLEPILPESSMHIQELIKANKKPEAPLFPRVEAITK